MLPIKLLPPCLLIIIQVESRASPISVSVAMETLHPIPSPFLHLGYIYSSLSYGEAELNEWLAFRKTPRKYMSDRPKSLPGQ